MNKEQEERFDKTDFTKEVAEFDWVVDLNKVKSFISSLLSEQREELEQYVIKARSKQRAEFLGELKSMEEYMKRKPKQNPNIEQFMKNWKLLMSQLSDLINKYGGKDGEA